LSVSQFLPVRPALLTAVVIVVAIALFVTEFFSIELTAALGHGGVGSVDGYRMRLEACDWRIFPYIEGPGDAECKLYNVLKHLF